MADTLCYVIGKLVLVVSTRHAAGSFLYTELLLITMCVDEPGHKIQDKDKSGPPLKLLAEALAYSEHSVYSKGATKHARSI